MACMSGFRALKKEAATEATSLSVHGPENAPAEQTQHFWDAGVFDVGCVVMGASSMRVMPTRRRRRFENTFFFPRRHTRTPSRLACCCVHSGLRGYPALFCEPSFYTRYPGRETRLWSQPCESLASPALGAPIFLRGVRGWAGQGLTGEHQGSPPHSSPTYRTPAKKF